MQSHGLLLTPLIFTRDCVRGRPTGKQSAATIAEYVREHSMCDILDLSVHKLSEKRCFLHCQKKTYVMGSEVDHACPCRNWDNGLQSLKQLSIFDLYTII